MRVRIDGLTGINKAAAFLIVCEMQGKLLWNGHLPYVIRSWELNTEGRLQIEFGVTLKPRYGWSWGLALARRCRKSVPLKPLLRKLRKLRCKKSNRSRSPAQRAAAAERFR
jgi:hypothetical protein